MRLLKWLLLLSSIVLLVGCSTGNNDEVTTMAGNDAIGQVGDAEENQELEPAGEAKEPWSDYVCVYEEGVVCPESTSINAADLGPFQKGVFLNEIEYPEKYAGMIKTLKANVTAWVAKDEQAFRDTFTSEASADANMPLLENPADYQIVGTPYIMDQSNDSRYIHIAIEFRNSEDESDIRNIIATFEVGTDSIYMLD